MRPGVDGGPKKFVQPPARRRRTFKSTLLTASDGYQWTLNEELSERQINMQVAPPARPLTISRDDTKKLPHDRTWSVLNSAEFVAGRWSTLFGERKGGIEEFIAEYERTLHKHTLRVRQHGDFVVVTHAFACFLGEMDDVAGGCRAIPSGFEHVIGCVRLKSAQGHSARSCTDCIPELCTL